MPVQIPDTDPAQAPGDAWPAPEGTASCVMTTGHPKNLQNATHLAVVSAHCTFGSEVVRDAYATVQPTMDGRAKAVEQTMKDSVDVVLHDLKARALGLGGDAVIGISITYTPVGYDASNMTLVSGVGTAVRSAPIPSA